MLTMIIDGNNLCYRCSAVMTLSTKDGFTTSGIYGTLNSIPSYLKEVEKLAGEPVNECIVTFDGGRSKRRMSLFPDYKGSRKSSEERTEEEKKWYEDFLQQTKILYENLPLFGIKTIQIKGWEADDLIYGLIRQSETVRDDVENHFVIISTDEDFLQLISPNISVYSPIKQIFYTYDNFVELFGCRPEHFISYKILKGDSSDNISGINGIGDKTGKKLVNDYGGLIGILNPVNRSTLMKSKVTQRIFTPEGLATIDRNNKLMNLKEFVDFTEVIEHLDNTLYESPSLDEKSVRAFLMKYQLSSLLVKWGEWIRQFKTLLENYYTAE